MTHAEKRVVRAFTAWLAKRGYFNEDHATHHRRRDLEELCEVFLVQERKRREREGEDAPVEVEAPADEPLGPHCVHPSVVVENRRRIMAAESRIKRIFELGDELTKRLEKLESASALAPASVEPGRVYDDGMLKGFLRWWRHNRVPGDVASVMEGDRTAIQGLVNHYLDARARGE